jgi:hypothetical protein
MTIVANHKQLRVSTPSGNQLFSHVQKFTRKGYIQIHFTDGTELRVSPKHPFIVNHRKKLAHELRCTDIIDGKRKDILHIDFIDEEIELFDLLNVENGNLYYTNDVVSHNCDFVGSVHTLISPSKLKTLAYVDPVFKNGEGFKVYAKPEEKHGYVMTVDVSRGTGNDYSAFSIIDITTTPYKLVATFRNNTMSPLVFPNAIHVAAKQYNNAHVLVEINDMGGQVADVLHAELEYENILSATMRGRKGQVLDGGFGSGQSQFGVRTTEVVKRTGCSILKSLVESEKMIIQDFDVIKELFAFVAKKNSFEAEVGYNDDLVMTLVLFGWLSTQPYFKDLSSLDIRKDIYQDTISKLEEEMTPFGFMDDGIEEPVPEKPSEDGYNTWWADRQSEQNGW